MDRKLQIYARCGVEEYYIYDPDRFTLKGYQRSDDLYLDRIDEMDGWTSPRLGITFRTIDNELQLTHPDGQVFETFDNVATERDLIRADNQRLEIDKQQLETDKQQLEIEKNKRDAKLRELGIDPDTL